MAPPLYRNRPDWYQRGLAQVASRFSAIMTADQPLNLFLLPSFISQDLSPDGVHLTAVSGLHYVLHLFDQSEAVLALDPREPELKLVKVQEAVRQHDDRLSYLESRHGNLQGNFGLKVAIDQEFRDWMTNRSQEDWLTIIGLPRLGQMTSREWQTAARRQVSAFFKEVLNAHRVRQEFTIMHIVNPVKHRPAGKTVLNVRLNSVHVSERLREIYSGFFRRANPIPLPPGFRGIRVSNTVTLETRIRIRIMQQLASNYLAANPGSTASVRGYDSRPMLMTLPPRGSTTLRPRNYNFIQACTMLPAVFSDDSLASIFQVVGNHHQNELRTLFIVLSDDDRARCEDLAKNYQPRAAGPGRSAPSASGHFSGAVAGSGAGMEVQSDLLRLLSSPPPPPPPPRTSSLAPSRAHQSSPSESDSRDPRSKRGLKRARQSSEERGSRRSKRARRTSGSSSSSSSDHRRKKKRSKAKSTKTTKSKSRSHRRCPSSSSSSASSGSAPVGTVQRER